VSHQRQHSQQHRPSRRGDDIVTARRPNRPTCLGCVNDLLLIRNDVKRPEHSVVSVHVMQQFPSVNTQPFLMHCRNTVRSKQLPVHYHEKLILKLTAFRRHVTFGFPRRLHRFAESFAHVELHC